MNETQPVSHKNVMVSYRGPLTVNQTPQGYESAKSDGGLVTVLTPIAENIPNSVWIGSPGIPEQGHIREFAEKAALEKSYGLGYFWLSQDEEKGAKHVYSDQVLWQAAHGEPQNIVYEPCAFNYYLEANRKAAEAALKELGPSDPVWFHDIQLMTAPRMMRTMGSNHDIGSYVHAQFPLPEHWGVVPERRELLYGHLASNLIGFQTVDDMENFTTNTQAYFKNSRLENTPQGLTINNQGEKTSVFVDPVGIDLDEFRNVANQPQTQERARQIEQELNGKHEILVVGRTDVTKAIPAAIRALETVLEKHPELIDKVHMTILAIPSRMSLPVTEELVREITAADNSINTKFHTKPVETILGRWPRQELVAHYMATDTFLVAPYSDGQNLIPSEGIAVNKKDANLVLSRSCGAYYTYGKNALVVNPRDELELETALYEALTQDAPSRARNFRELQHSLEENTVWHYYNRWQAEMGKIRNRNRIVIPSFPKLTA